MEYRALAATTLAVLTVAAALAATALAVASTALALAAATEVASCAARP